MAMEIVLEKSVKGPSAGEGLAVEPSVLRPGMCIQQSEKWWKRCQGLIPAGTQTLSKGPTQFVEGVAPKYLLRGKGSHVWDVDGNEYIDYPMGLGPVTLGHGHPAVVEAVQRQLEQGITFSLMHPLEVELAEKLREVVPCCQMVRYGKNGSDATAAAVRAARALTGRDLIVCCGYHGWQDWYIATKQGVRAKGIPQAVKELTLTFTYNDPASLEKIFEAYPGRVAGVILEPVSTTPPHPGFLEQVKEITHRHGAVLIFDEIITGFRYARGGAQEYFGVIPDLATMGKGVANGMPLSLVLGRKEYMEIFEEIFFSFTFGGECLSLAAALATIRVMEEEDYWSHVWRLGGRLQQGYRDMTRHFGLQELTDCIGLPPWTVIEFYPWQGQDPLLIKSLFQQEMLKRGILFSGSQFISLSHSDQDIDRTLEAYWESFKVLKQGLEGGCLDRLLQGKPVSPVFVRSPHEPRRS